MKVAFVHPFFLRYPRGIERYTANLASALVKQNIDVDILTWKWYPPLSWSELDIGVRLKAFPMSRYYTASLVWPFYFTHLLKNSYDHLLIHFADYGEAPALNWLLRMKPKTRFSIVLHFPYSQVPHRYRSFVNSGLLEKAQHVIAVSQFVAREAEAFSGRSCQVISHGVDTARFRPDPAQKLAMRKRLGFDSDAVILLTVAALEKRKGIQDVLFILPALLDKHPKVRFVVVGAGPDQDEIASVLTNMDLDYAVRMLPADPEILPYYQAADIFIILARGEASSLVTLEALACELPVIASNYPPFDELITLEWGFQVDPSNPKQVLAALESLVSSQELRQKLGKAGREYVSDSHRWEAIAGQYIQFFLSQRENKENA
jgi:glycosyltransferase involved in cell wall biosynthesis